MTLRRIEVLDVDRSADKPIAAFEAEQIDALLQPIGAPTPAGGTDPRQLGAGVTVVAFMWIAFDTGASVPNRLRHRVLTADSSAEGAVINTHHTQLHVLGPPLEGANWRASDGPSNAQDNHHRRGVFIVDGRAVISRRYAIDWDKFENGTRFSGDARDKRSYHAYGESVFAVADAKVITARDGLPDNVPGHNEAFHPAVPITNDTLGGNTITLDLGGGQFAYYFHLQPGSLRVKAGDQVRRGQLLACIGASGDAREPHLHFEVTTSPAVLGGEGVPYLIDHFRPRSPDGSWQPRTHELPLDEMHIDFGSAAGRN
jgi:murein DD-endopeptidase MepM/ murein hydrolase activator NlpD